jgi:hypothetical protein
MRRPLQVRLASCGEEGVVVECACGRRTVAVRCGARWLCPSCRGQMLKRLRRRLSKALKARVAAARRVGQRRPGFRREAVLVTLTARHSGDLAADRQRIGEAWRKLRQWMHGRARVQTWRRDHLEAQQKAWHPPLAQPSGWVDTDDAVGAFDYALVWEATAGDDGRGHVHAHAVVLWPRTDWHRLRLEWKRAIGDDGAEIDLERPTKGGGTDVQNAAFYLCKYASKGVDVAEFSPELAARVIDATYGKRVCSTSRGFWLPEQPCACPTCRRGFTVVEKPSPRRACEPVWRTHGAQVVIVEDAWTWSSGRSVQTERVVPLDGEGRIWGTLARRDNSLERLLIP